MDDPNIDPRPLPLNLHRFDHQPAEVSPSAAVPVTGARVIVLTRRTYILAGASVLGLLLLGVLGAYGYGLWLQHQEQHRRADWVYQIIQATVQQQQQQQRQQQQGAPPAAALPR